MRIRYHLPGELLHHAWRFHPRHGQRKDVSKGSRLTKSAIEHDGQIQHCFEQVCGLTEEKQKGDAVQDEDVRHMGDMRVGENLHLLLGGTHEEETGGIKEKRRKVLEAVGIIPIGRESVFIPKHEGDLYNSRQASGHQCIAKDGVNHGGNGKVLWVSRHAPASQQNDNARNEIPLGSPVACAAQPDAHQAGAPPDNAHSGVLQVVCDPGSTPAVLSEGVDAAPCCNDHRVEELLAASRLPEPQLAYQK